MDERAVVTPARRVSVLGFIIGAAMVLIIFNVLLASPAFTASPVGLMLGAIFVILALAVTYHFSRVIVRDEKDALGRRGMSGDRRAGVRAFARLSMYCSVALVIVGFYMVAFRLGSMSVVYFVTACLIFMYYYFVSRSMEVPSGAGRRPGSGSGSGGRARRGGNGSGRGSPADRGGERG